MLPFLRASLVLAPAFGLQACLTPPVVLPAQVRTLAAALATFPEPHEALELAAVDGARLRGVFVPAEEGAAVVLHLLGATDSFAEKSFSHRPHVAQLRDLGLASLVIDYRGVGLSAGERSPEHLADDAWVMWQEAVRRAGGDPGRVGIRATSLGTIATALLLARGAQPGAITLVAPVMPDSVVRSYALVEYGGLVAGLARLLFAPVAELDFLGEYRRFAGSWLVCASQADRFLPSAQRAALERLVEEKDAAWFDMQGGHYESSLAARALFTRERLFWSAALPPVRPARTPEELLGARPELTAAFAARPEARAHLARLLALKRQGDPELLAALALALPDERIARELAWSIEQRPYPSLPLQELVETLSLDDPSGPLPFDLLADCLARLDHVDRIGLVRIAFDASSIAQRVSRADEGRAVFMMRYTIAGESAVVTLAQSELWTELLQRGYALDDARRVLARILLRAERIPERYRPENGGFAGLEVFEEGAWKPLVDEPGILRGSIKL